MAAAGADWVVGAEEEENGMVGMPDSGAMGAIDGARAVVDGARAAPKEGGAVEAAEDMLGFPSLIPCNT
jgi:hypothetical protein